MPGRGLNSCLTPGLYAGVLGGGILFSDPAAAQSSLGDMIDQIAAMATEPGRMDMRLIAISVITFSLAVLLLAISGVLVMYTRRARRLLRESRYEAAALRNALDRSEALLETQDSVSVIWRPEGPSIVGRLPEASGVPGDIKQLLTFGRWLDANSAQALMSRAAALIERGEAFRISARSRTGAFLEIAGHVAGGHAVMLLRALAGDSLEIARLADKADALRRDHEAMHNLLGSISLPAWSIDTSGRITWVNECYARMVDAKDGADVLARRLSLLDEAGRRAILDHAPDMPTFQGQFQGRVGERQARFSVAVARTGAGSICIARDISELEDMRDELSRHIEAHARTLDSISIAVATFGADRRLRFYNAAYAQLWRADEDWLRSGPLDFEILDALRGAGRLPEQADYRGWRARQLEALGVKDGSAQVWHLPDGQTLRVTAQANAFGGATCLYENMTEKLELESRHNALMNVQRETLDNLSEGVALFSSDGRLRLFNPAFAKLWRLGFSELESGPHIDQIVALSRVMMDDQHAWDRLKQRVTALADGRQPDQIRFERPDGSVIDCTIVPLPGGSTLVTYMDVTDTALAERALRERNDALEAADEMKSAFIRHVSYVLRAPLTTIIGYTDLLTRDPSGALTEKQREFAEHVLTSSHALLAIINDILDLATLDAGAMELEYAPVDMVGVMEAAADGLRDRLREANIDLKIVERGDLTHFVADSKRLKQVLFNLLSNAVTFSDPGGRITLAGQREGNEVHIVISDNGKGIPEDLQDAVFERFEGRAAGTGHRGVGLGLSIVKGLVELHGGDVRLTSQPGNGTTIDCVFPISPDVPRPVRGGASSTLPAADRLPPHVEQSSAQ